MGKEENQITHLMDLRRRCQYCLPLSYLTQIRIDQTDPSPGSTPQYTKFFGNHLNPPILLVPVLCPHCIGPNFLLQLAQPPILTVPVPQTGKNRDARLIDLLGFAAGAGKVKPPKPGI